VCIQSTWHTKCYLPCCLLCTAQKAPSPVHCLTSHPVSSSSLPQLLLLFGSLLTVFSYCWAFYAISVCFWLQNPLKNENSAELCAPCIVVFPLTPHTYWPLAIPTHIYLYLHVRIHYLCYFWLSLAVKTLEKKRKMYLLPLLGNGLISLPFYIFKIS